MFDEYDHMMRRDAEESERERKRFDRELYDAPRECCAPREDYWDFTMEAAANEERSTLWEDYEENWVEMTEFRLPPARARRMQLEFDFSSEVA